MASIVVVGPHPDDQELAMGGTIALLASQGHRVTLVDVTDGEPTPHGDPATREAEALRAAAILGEGFGGRVARVGLGLTNRRVESTIEARHRMAGAYRALRAEIVFLPHPDDAHPDHRAVTRLAEDARFDAKLTKIDMPTPAGLDAGPPIYPRWVFHYYASHLRAVPAPAFLMDVSAYAARKVAAVRAYRSQFEANPANRGVVGMVEASLAYFGSRAGVAAAEPFSGPEPIALSGLGSLAGI